MPFWLNQRHRGAVSQRTVEPGREQRVLAVQRGAVRRVAGHGVGGLHRAVHPWALQYRRQQLVRILVRG